MNIAIIGSGPSAFYTVQSFLRENPSTNIDIFEKLPAPFGLVRYGVAPDHQKTKNIIRLFTKYLYENNVNYYGNVEIGKTIALETLSNIYDAVVVSSGAPEDKNLIIDNNSTVKIYGSAQFVGWYNGNPIHSNLSPNFNCKNIVIIGNGNVALDCARVIAKTKEEFYQSDIMEYALSALNQSSVENIYIIGRRTPKDAKFTISELREMADLKSYKPEVDYDEKEMLKVLESNDIDTKVKKNIEFYSVMRSIQALENSDVAIIMIDAKQGFEGQDMNILSLAVKYKKGIIIMVNKWDLIKKDNSSLREYEKNIQNKISPFSYIPIIFSSVLKKQRILQTLEKSLEIFENRKQKISTSQLNNKILPEIQKYPPPSTKGKYIKIKYITQLPTNTPTFAFFCNLPQYIKEPYKRFVMNKLRDHFTLDGVPISLVFRKK